LTFAAPLSKLIEEPRTDFQRLDQEIPDAPCVLMVAGLGEQDVRVPSTRRTHLRFLR